MMFSKIILATALLLAYSSNAQQLESNISNITKLTLLHVNDHHSHLTEKAVQDTSIFSPTSFHQLSVKTTSTQLIFEHFMEDTQD